MAGEPPEPLQQFRTRSIGYIGASVHLGRRTRTYWYNPKTQTSERVTDPSDEEAIRMLAGHPNSATFVSEYAELRRSDTPIERALVSVGHEERLRQHAYMPVRLAERDRPGRKARPSATGYELLLAVRLREEGKDRQRGRRS